MREFWRMSRAKGSFFGGLTCRTGHVAFGCFLYAALARSLCHTVGLVMMSRAMGLGTLWWKCDCMAQCHDDLRSPVSKRVSYKSAVYKERATRECPTRVSHETVPKEHTRATSIPRVSGKEFECPQKCLTECPTTMSHESVPQRVFHQSVPPDCTTRVSHQTVYKSVPPDCATRVPYKSVPQECQTMSGRLFPSACVHSGLWVAC